MIALGGLLFGNLLLLEIEVEEDVVQAAFEDGGP